MGRNSLGGESCFAFNPIHEGWGGDRERSGQVVLTYGKEGLK